NTLVIRVDNRPRIEFLPASEQIEWIQYGGIIEPVKVVSKSRVYIDDLVVRTTEIGDDAKISCVISIANDTDREVEVDIQLEIVGHGDPVQRSLKAVCPPNAKKVVDLNLDLAGVKLWSPDDPALYRANVYLDMGDDRVDAFSDRFGIRTVSVEGTSILLNGRPVQIKGSHRYDPYDRYGPNVPVELIKEELALMKSVGINTIRSHYPVSPTILDLLDEFGF